MRNNDDITSAAMICQNYLAVRCGALVWRHLSLARAAPVLARLYVQLRERKQEETM